MITVKLSFTIFEIRKWSQIEVFAHSEVSILFVYFFVLCWTMMKRRSSDQFP